MKKRFVVEIEIPENTGDLCWDHDETGLQAFHECIVTPLYEVNLNWHSIAAESESEGLKHHIKKKNKVRSSFKVISPKPE